MEQREFKCSGNRGPRTETEEVLRELDDFRPSLSGAEHTCSIQLQESSSGSLHVLPQDEHPGIFSIDQQGEERPGRESAQLFDSFEEDRFSDNFSDSSSVERQTISESNARASNIDHGAFHQETHSERRKRRREKRRIRLRRRILDECVKLHLVMNYQGPVLIPTAYGVEKLPEVVYSRSNDRHLSSPDDSSIDTADDVETVGVVNPSDKQKSRGNYNCSLCGMRKENHVCRAIMKDRGEQSSKFVKLACANVIAVSTGTGEIVSKNFAQQRIEGAVTESISTLRSAAANIEEQVRVPFSGIWSSSYPAELATTGSSKEEDDHVVLESSRDSVLTDIAGKRKSSNQKLPNISNLSENKNLMGSSKEEDDQPVLESSHDLVLTDIADQQKTSNGKIPSISNLSENKNLMVLDDTVERADRDDSRSDEESETVESTVAV